MTHTPIRLCAGCFQALPQKDLVKIIRLPSGKVRIAKSHDKGRSMYLCPSWECFEKAVLKRRKGKHAIRFALHVQLTPELKQNLIEHFQQFPKKCPKL